MSQIFKKFIPKTDYIDMTLSIIVPVILYYFNGNPYFIQQYLTLFLGSIIYTYLIILLRCKKYDLWKETLLSSAIWILWLITIFILSYIAKGPIILADAILRSYVGVLIIGIVYWYCLAIFTECF